MAQRNSPTGCRRAARTRISWAPRRLWALTPPAPAGASARLLQGLAGNCQEREKYLGWVCAQETGVDGCSKRGRLAPARRRGTTKQQEGHATKADADKQLLLQLSKEKSDQTRDKPPNETVPHHAKKTPARGAILFEEKQKPQKPRPTTTTTDLAASAAMDAESRKTPAPSPHCHSPHTLGSLSRITKRSEPSGGRGM